MLLSLSKSIKVDELAAAMMKTAMEGTKTQIMENADLKAVGQDMLKADVGR
jgi:hypothetical protein